MPDKRQPGGQGIEPETATTLIDRRRAFRKEIFTGSGGTDAAAFDSSALTAENAEWLEERDVSLNAVVTMERIREQYQHQFSRLMSFSGDYTKLRILHGLIEHRLGVTYDTLEGYVDVTRRTLKEHVGTLVDVGVLEREGNPAQIRFVDEDRYLLAVEAAAVPSV